MTDQPAALRVVSGDPTPEELAVVTSVLSAVAAASPAGQSGAQRGRWSIPAMRRTLAHGPGGWRASAGMR